MDNAKNRADQEKQLLIGDLEQAVETLRSNSGRILELEKSWHESEWYLGEAKARNQRLEDELREKEHYIRKLEAQNHQLQEKLAEFTLPLAVKDKSLHLEPVPPRKSLQ
ncbi:MAG: hypothetical protein HQL20_06005 [Candidatus Omnitrophica bacterium]|nr:hypothetical protein [Candidatus Omnitrophota bacterium]